MSSPPPKTPGPEHRAFADGLLQRIARRPAPVDSAQAHANFRRLVQQPWDDLVCRLAGQAARRTLARRLGADVPPDGWHVRGERWVGPDRRVDVEISIPGVWCCFIEAKIDAGDGRAQLRDYLAALLQRGAGLRRPPTLVFLTPDGRPGDPAVSIDSYQPLSYEDLLRCWLPVAAAHPRQSVILSCWLVTLARALYGACEPGPFSSWSLAMQRRTLALLRDLEEVT